MERKLAWLKRNRNFGRPPYGFGLHMAQLILAHDGDTQAAVRAAVASDPDGAIYSIHPTSLYLHLQDCRSGLQEYEDRAAHQGDIDLLTAAMTAARNHDGWD